MFMIVRIFILVIVCKLLYFQFGVDYSFVKPSWFLYKVLMVGLFFSLLFFYFNRKSDLKILNEIKEEVNTSTHYIGPVLRTMTFSFFLYVSAIFYFVFLNLNEYYKVEVPNSHIEIVDGNPTLVDSYEVKDKYYSVYKGVIGDFFYYK